MSQAPDSLSEIVDTLFEDAYEATWYIGYLKAVVDQEIAARKVAGSYSGRALETAQAGVKQALVLYCARTWERAPDARRRRPVISLPLAIQNLKEPDALLREWQDRVFDDEDLEESERAARRARMGRRITTRHQEVMTRFEELRDLPTHGAMRILRTEYFAHRAPNSEDRKKIEELGRDTDATWNGLLDLAEATVTLVGDLAFFTSYCSNPFPERILQAHAECLEFWRVLPVLAEVENDPAPSPSANQV